MKCGIPEKQIRQDAYGFLERLDSLTEDEDNHFTREDVKDALKASKQIISYFRPWQVGSGLRNRQRFLSHQISETDENKHSIYNWRGVFDR